VTSYGYSFSVPYCRDPDRARKCERHTRPRDHKRPRSCSQALCGGLRRLSALPCSLFRTVRNRY